MKNFLLIFNVLLAVAVAYLFYKVGKGGNASNTNSSVVLNAVNAEGVYFVNTDSLWKNFKMVKTLEEEYALEKTKLEGQFKVRYQALEKEVVDMQTRFQKGLMSQDEAQKGQYDIAQKEQKLMDYKDELSVKLLDMEKNMNDKIQEEITAYMNLFAEEKKLQYVLGYTRGAGSMLYGKDSLEVTAEVVEGLNGMYLKKSEK